MDGVSLYHESYLGVLFTNFFSLKGGRRYVIQLKNNTVAIKLPFLKIILAWPRSVVLQSESILKNVPVKFYNRLYRFLQKGYGNIRLFFLNQKRGGWITRALQLQRAVAGVPILKDHQSELLRHQLKDFIKFRLSPKLAPIKKNL